MTTYADMVLVVVGVRPDTALAAQAGAGLGIGGASRWTGGMHTNLESVFAAGDCVVTHHRLTGLASSHSGPRHQAGPGGRRERHRWERGPSPAVSGPRS